MDTERKGRESLRRSCLDRSAAYLIFTLALLVPPFVYSQDDPAEKDFRRRIRFRFSSEKPEGAAALPAGASNFGLADEILERRLREFRAYHVAVSISQRTACQKAISL
jgi:hypothetical protein